MPAAHAKSKAGKKNTREGSQLRAHMTLKKPYVCRSSFICHELLFSPAAYCADPEAPEVAHESHQGQPSQGFPCSCRLSLVVSPFLFCLLSPWPARASAPQKDRVAKCTLCRPRPLRDGDLRSHHAHSEEIHLSMSIGTSSSRKRRLNVRFLVSPGTPPEDATDTGFFPWGS